LAEKLDKNKKLQISESSCQQLANPYPAHHDIQSHNDHQMSLDYHLVDPFAWGDDDQDEQQSDVLDGY
jgi:hypothetical protein